MNENNKKYLIDYLLEKFKTFGIGLVQSQQDVNSEDCNREVNKML